MLRTRTYLGTPLSPLSCREDAGLSGGRVQPALAEPGGLLLDAAEQQQGRCAQLVPPQPTGRTGWGHPLTSVCVPPQLTEHDTDSDSDLSLEDDPSGSYGSTHSSDSEDEAAGAGWDALLRPEQPPAPTGKSHNGGAGGVAGPGGAPWLSSPVPTRR